jgi:CubicO group peptidase (beta-lactamase class C family)
MAFIPNNSIPALAFALLSAFPAMGYDFSQVDRLVEDSLAAFGDSVVVVIKKDDQVIYHNRKGNLDSTSKIGIASSTKWISGAVILRLAEKNHFKLDDSLGAYLPTFTKHGKGHITIRQCFAMTSGLYGGKHFELNPLLSLQRSTDSIAASSPLAAPPGTQMAYDGNGMQAVGRIAEIVTGKPWAQVAREEILDPCDMPTATYDNLGPLNPAIAGGIRTSAREYLHFLEMVMGKGVYKGKRVLSAASVAEMFRNQTGEAPIVNSPWPPSPASHPDGRPPRYAFGCWAMATNATTGEEDEIASPGYYGSFPWADRCRGIYGMVLVHNGGEGSRSHVAAIRLTALVRQEVGGCVSTGLEGRTPAPHSPWAVSPSTKSHPRILIGDGDPFGASLISIDGRCR